jgi:excisionase family DNA binding protein
MFNEDRLLTLDEAATILNVSKKTLRRWDESGKLVAHRTPGTEKQLGHRKYLESDIKDMIEAGDMSIPHIKEKYALNKPDPQVEIDRLTRQLEKLEKENHIMSTQAMGIVSLAARMRNLLEVCRQQMLPMDIAREIDRILREAKEYD